MAQTQVLGGGNLQPGVPLAVDPLFQAARIALRPLDYTNIGKLLGHYRALQVSGNTVSLAAAAMLGSLRWTDPTSFFVLMRLRAAWAVNGAITAATIMDLQALIARAFSVDFTTNSTPLSLAGVTNTNKMRSSMGSSLLGVIGPRILTTAAMSGQTLTPDAAPFGATVWANQPSGNATVTQAVGVAGPMQELYKYDSLAEHPVVLAANEGIIVQPVTAGPVTGTVKYYLEWTWAEVAVF